MWCAHAHTRAHTQSEDMWKTIWCIIEQSIWFWFASKVCIAQIVRMTISIKLITELSGVSMVLLPYCLCSHSESLSHRDWRETASSLSMNEHDLIYQTCRAVNKLKQKMFTAAPTVARGECPWCNMQTCKKKHHNLQTVTQQPKHAASTQSMLTMSKETYLCCGKVLKGMDGARKISPENSSDILGKGTLILIIRITFL